MVDRMEQLAQQRAAIEFQKVDLKRSMDFGSKMTAEMIKNAMAPRGRGRFCAKGVVLKEEDALRYHQKTESMHRQYPDSHMHDGSGATASAFHHRASNTGGGIWQASASFLMDSGLSMGLVTSVAYLCAVLFTASQCAELAAWVATRVAGERPRQQRVA